MRRSALSADCHAEAGNFASVALLLQMADTDLESVIRARCLVL